MRGRLRSAPGAGLLSASLRWLKARKKAEFTSRGASQRAVLCAAYPLERRAAARRDALGRAPAPGWSSTARGPRQPLERRENGG